MAAVYSPPSPSLRRRRVRSLLGACATLGFALVAGAQSSATLDPYATVEAEAFDTESGTRPASVPGAVGFIEDGDYIGFEQVDFGRGPRGGEATASSARAGGVIEFRVDAPDGPLVAEADVTSTGGWANFEAFAIEPTSDFSDGTVFLGVRDLYLVFRGGGGYLFDVDAFAFTSADVPATGVEIANCPSVFSPLDVGDALDLDAEVFPVNAVNASVSFTSSDPSVVAVDDLLLGELSAVAPGTATITVVTFDGGFRDACEIRVQPDPIDPYETVAANSFTTDRGTKPGANRAAVGFIQDGDFLSFDRVVFGRGPAAGTVRASSATSGGTIEFRVGSPTGILVARSAIANTSGWSTFEEFPVEVVNDYSDGTAFLGTRDLFLVFRGGGGFLFDVAEFSFTSADVSVTGVALAECPSSLTVGESFAFAAAVSPPDAVNPSVSYDSSDDDVVAITDLLAGEITGVAPGTATVTVRTFDGNFSDACEIEVVAAPAARSAQQSGAASVAFADVESLAVYPNPSPAGVFHLSRATSAGEGALYDAHGRHLRDVLLEPGGSVDLSALPAGVYLLRSVNGATATLVIGG